MSSQHQNHSNSPSHDEEDPDLFDVASEGESGRSGFDPKQFFFITWRSSCKVSKWVNIFWPFVPLAIVLQFATPHRPMLIFIITYIGMIPAANLIGFAGQELARKMPKVAGILIETALGSIVEIVLFIVLIARHEPGYPTSEGGNLIPVIQAAILGSILTNLLLCLGLCFFVAGLRQRVQTFHASVSEVGSGLLLVAGFGLLIPSAFYSALKSETVSVKTGNFVFKASKFTEEQLHRDIMRISQITAIILMIAFGIYIFYNAQSQHSIFDEIIEADEHKDADHHEDAAKAKYTYTECILALTVSLTLVTVLAYFLVEKIEDVVEAGVPDQFLGLILIPLVEKAAEHLTAIDEADDGAMNLALYHCIGPSIQTALFNGPLVVIVGWFIGKPMDLNFEIFMITLLVLSILVVGNFLRDKESNYLEGALLVIIYVIVAIAAWYYPNPDEATSNGLEEAIAQAFNIQPVGLNVQH